MSLERSCSRPKLFIIFLSCHQITCEVDLKFPQVADMTRKEKLSKTMPSVLWMPNNSTTYIFCLSTLDSGIDVGPTFIFFQPLLPY